MPSRLTDCAFIHQQTFKNQSYRNKQIEARNTGEVNFRAGKNEQPILTFNISQSNRRNDHISQETKPFKVL